MDLCSGINHEKLLLDLAKPEIDQPKCNNTFVCPGLILQNFLRFGFQKDYEGIPDLVVMGEG